jgi:tRNA threonylcarbamoyladenosine biosynthesis protein TsaE
MPEAELTLEAMQAFGESLGSRLAPGTVVTLSGELGAGKTTLVQAIARGYGVREPVTSPTFALVHEYHGARSAVLHLDLYRLDGPHQLANIGWEDVLVSGALVLIEWPERAAGALPRGAVPLRVAHTGGSSTTRRVSW